MIITYFTHSPYENKTRRVFIGNKLVGIRLLSATVESNDELELLLSDKGREWAKRNMRFTPQPLLSQNTKESHWGSDWVDDGV